MIITDEILAAYVDGTLPQSHVEAVRQYLATHPQEMETVVRLMDRDPVSLPKSTKRKQQAMPKSERSFACYASPMAKKDAPTRKKRTIMDNIDSLFDQIF